MLRLMNRRTLPCLLSLPALLAVVTAAKAESIPAELRGDWSLIIASGDVGWLSVAEVDGEPRVAMLVEVGPIQPRKGVTVKNGTLHIPLKSIRESRDGPVIATQSAEVSRESGQLKGEILTRHKSGTVERDPFTGIAIPPMPPAPDLSEVKFGEPVTLFNGKDLTGWRLRRPGKINGWSVEDGLLVNNTPKTDFSATGAYGNLRTDAVFEDFTLHIEFLIEKDRNSGVYLRGMYEAQVVDRDSRMQGLQGVGSIFGRVEATENAGLEGGQWQTYELTLVDRHITVVLNGKKVVDNQPVPGPTGGAMHTDPMAPGPIYLQGDHTSVKYRNIVLTPVVKAP